jgi:hypothetical protein
LTHGQFEPGTVVDRDLLARFAEGDQAAFELLLVPLWSKLTREESER